MDVMRIHAPSDAHARRLLASLDGDYSASMNGDGKAAVVGITLDADSAAKLVSLFNALGEWLTAAGLASCQINFGDRAYTLLPSVAGSPNDPAAFLLERTIQLQTALESRIVIEQAKGILAERNLVSPEQAFENMRREARSRRMKLHELAAGIVATTGGVSKNR